MINFNSTLVLFWKLEPEVMYCTRASWLAPMTLDPEEGSRQTNFAVADAKKVCLSHSLVVNILGTRW